MKPRALDLFCCAGGASRGLQLAGYHVTGVDLVASKNYIGDAFVQADAMSFDLAGFDFIWASPPCQRFSTIAKQAGVAGKYPDFIGVLREALKSTAAIWAIENVPGAPLNGFRLCGSMFGLGVRRHRVVETNFPWQPPKCRHTEQPYPIDVSGNGGPRRRPMARDPKDGGNTRKPEDLAEARAAMGIDWMTRRELSQAIPPDYSLYVARCASAGRPQ
jgi:DNA (cytosine-5)-methyltransferase 1